MTPKQNKTWINFEVEILKNMYGEIPLWAIAVIINKSFWSVREKIRELKLSSKRVYKNKNPQTGENDDE